MPDALVLVICLLRKTHPETIGAEVDRILKEMDEGLNVPCMLAYSQATWTLRGLGMRLPACTFC